MAHNLLCLVALKWGWGVCGDWGPVMRRGNSIFFTLTTGLLLALSFPFAPIFVTHAQTIGQIDATPLIERLTVAQDGRLYAWDKEGRVIAGWPKNLSQENRFFSYQPRLVDVDFDLQEEVVALSQDLVTHRLRLHVFKGSGQEIPTWRFDLEHLDLHETPHIADVNHDSSLDIIYATRSRHVYVYRRDLRLLRDFSLDVLPAIAVGDPDNNGREDLFVAAEDQLWRWDPLEAELNLFPLPSGGEPILGSLIFVDVNDDLYPDIIYATAANRILAVDRNGRRLFSINPPQGTTLASGVVSEDIDLDRDPELIVLSEAQDILAFETNGTPAAHWRQPLLYRHPRPSGGVVANDVYPGLFSSASGWDLYAIYRNRLGGYSRVLVGENVHDFDAEADFQFVEAVSVTDLFSVPQLFTPNGDGINDSVQIHYRLSDDALVALDLYDSHERFIARLMERAPRGAGEHQETINGLDTRGTMTVNDDTPLDTGAYVVRVVAQSEEGFVSSARAAVLVNGLKAEIESPQEGASVFGSITVSGIATDPNFGENSLDADFRSYKLYYRPGVWNLSPEEAVLAGAAGSSWIPMPVPLRHQCSDNAQNEPNDTDYPNSNVSCRPVQHGVLGTFSASDPAQTPNGEYTLLLKTLDSGGNTVGEMHYDTAVVTVRNPLASDPYNPDDLYDLRNPDNPLYQGPRLANVSLSNALISREYPSTTIAYALENETSNIHIDIFPVIGGVPQAAVSAYSFNRLAPASYQLVWNGTNTLGRNVDGGHYQIRITANAIDGTGVAVNESLELDVARGYSARDILAVEFFAATPDRFNPFNFGEDMLAERTTLSFALNKEARVTLQVFDRLPEEGGVVQKTLLAGQTFRTGSVLWDGSANSGVILDAGRDYLVRLRAVGIDVGNDEAVHQDILVRLEQPALDPSLSARLDRLVGDEDEEFLNDGALYSMEGSPDFIWRARATGYLEVPFEYQIGAYGRENYNNLVGPFETSVPLYVCGVVCGGIGPCPNVTDQTTASITLPNGAEITSFDVRVEGAHAHIIADNFPGIHEEFDLDNGSRGYSQPFPSSLRNWSSVSFSGYERSGGMWTESDCPTRDGECSGGYRRWRCGSMYVSARGGTSGERSWPLPGQAPPSTSGNFTLQSLSALPVTVDAYSAQVGSGQEDVLNAWITGYNLSLTNRVNGYETSGASGGSIITLPALAGWLNGGTLLAETRDNNGGRISVFDSALNDPYTLVTPYNRIWGWHRNFNDDEFHRLTAPINFYSDGYRPYVFGGDPERNLYTFSDVVRLTDWEIELRYPNISVNHPDGENPLNTGGSSLNVFALDEIHVEGPGVRGNQNSNIEDNFRLRLLPEAQPRRFVEIWGSAAPNYELFYYDADEADPRWHAIPVRTRNAVVDGLLAHWDVTRLNGEHYTLVLRSTNGDQVNQDEFNIGIGARVDTSQLAEGEFARVSSPFMRASLLFGPNALSQPELVTINAVPGEEADFRLPSGVAPLGPIFEVQPDGVEIDPRFHVQLEIVYTPDELREAFGVADASELQIYNLTGDEILEGLATVIVFDDGDDADPTNDVYRFTASLEHFSQYILARREVGRFYITSPRSDSFLRDIVSIEGRIESEPRPFSQEAVEGELAPITRLTISYYDPQNPSDAILIHEGAEAAFAIPWDVSNLEGNFVLRFAAENAQGIVSRFELPVAVDNRAGSSTLLVNGVALADGSSLTVGPDAVIEFRASDETAGVGRIEFAWDGAPLGDYLQPFTVPFASGTHAIAYRAIDLSGNAEALKAGSIRVEETIADEAAQASELTLTTSGPLYTRGDETWVTAATQFSLAANASPLNNIRYRAGFPIYRDYQEPFQLNGEEGVYNIDYYAVDSFGLRGNVYSERVLLDNSAPVSQLTAEEEHQRSGDILLITPQTRLILNALDQGVQPVGVSRIEYRFDEEPWVTYREPLSMSVSRRLSFRAVDLLGNTELERAVTVRLDDIPPAVLITGVSGFLSPNGDGRNDELVFNITASDNFSGQLVVDSLRLVSPAGRIYRIWRGRPLVAAAGDLPNVYRLTWDGSIEGEVLPEGRYFYTLTVQDAMGNISAQRGGQFIYDVTPPQVALLGGQVLQFSPNGDSLADILQVDYEVGDNLAQENIIAELHIETPEGFEIRAVSEAVSLPPAQHQFSWDGSNLANNPVFDGTYRFRVIAQDPAGNRSLGASGEAQESFGEIFVDRIAPETAITVSPPSFNDGAKTWLGSGAQITLSASDPSPSSGVVRIEYAFGDAAMIPYAEPFTAPLEGIDYTLTFRALDNVGNRENDQTAMVRLDQTPPVVEASVGEPKIGEGDVTWISPVTPVTLEAADPEGSGVRAIYFETPDVDDTFVYERPFSLAGLSDGLKTIYYWAVDNVENVGQQEALEARLDGTPPVTTLVVGDPKVWEENLLYVTSESVLDFTTTAERDDIEKTEYRIDEGNWLIAGPFQFPNEGNYLLSYRAQDRLWNLEPTHLQDIVVDNTPPDPLLGLSQGDGGHYVTRQTLISLDPNASGAGADITEYRINDGPWQLYRGPFDLRHLSAGSYTIYFRSRDRLGNVSSVKQFEATLIDVTVTREDFAVPRTLVYLLQRFDLRDDDPKPNEEFLKDLLEEMGGYYRLTADLDEFIALMRSDKFTTTIFATDSLVVNFGNDEKMVRTFRELKSRIDKGEAFINLAGFSRIAGDSWTMFRENWTAGGSEAVQLLGIAPELQRGAGSYQYGNGRLVEFNNNVGNLAGGENGAVIRQAMADLIHFVRPREDRLNAGEVIDSRLTFENSGDQDVTIDVREIFPSGGWIETRATGAEVPVETRDYTLRIPASDQVAVDYLYRMPFEVADQAIVTEVRARWESGVADQISEEVPYRVEADLNGLLASVAKVPVDLSTGVDVEALLDDLLNTIDATPRTSRETQINLDETVESAQLAQVARGTAPASAEGDPNDPTSFHGDTASYLAGSCQLNSNTKVGGTWWLLLLGILVSLRGVRRKSFIWIASAFGFAMTIVINNVYAGDTGLQGFDRHIFKPAADQTGVYNLVGTAIPKQWQIRTGFATSFGKDPNIVVVPATGRTVEILDWFWGGDFMVSTGYWDHWSFGLALPVLFYGNGTNFNSLQSYSASALGDVRLDLKYRLIKEGEKYPAIAFFSGFGFPTGSRAKFTGERGVTWNYRVAADKNIKDLELFTNLGFKLRRTVTVLSSNYGDTFLFGGGGRYRLPWRDKTWAVETELVGERFFTNTVGNSVPLEWRLGGRKKLDEKRNVYFGVGRGLTNAVGSPQFRLFGGLEWNF